MATSKKVTSLRPDEAVPLPRESPEESRRSGKKILGTRRQGREAALQALYLADLCIPELPQVPAKAWADEPFGTKAREFAEHLASGVIESREAIDALLKKYAENWDLIRMAAIDRCVLRLATFEILRDAETPVNVIINEAVEIVKKYSTGESSRFVNGILDKIKQERV